MPYWRLSTFYFFYFGALGALVPFWGLYLQSVGFSPLEIGQLMAILMATKVVAPYLWGWLGDYLGHRMRIVRAASLVSAAVFGGMFWAQGYWQVAAVMVSFSFFWNASLPQFEVVTFAYLAEQVRRYARVRVWGSVGFIFTVVALGVWVDASGARVVLAAVLVLYIGIWLSTLFVDDPNPEPHPAGQPGILSVIRRPAILAFFAAVFFMQMSHGAYYAFYSIYMEDQGYSKTLIGQLWGLGVLAEVVLFVFMHRLLDRWGGRRVLVASLLIAAVRWVLIGTLPGSLAVMIVAQLLHAATFGAFHASAIHLVHHYFLGRHKGRGQALYSSLSFGAGGALGSLSSGVTWETLGPMETYLIATGVALLGAFAAWRFIDAAHDH
ncbi:MAG: MFS transporter [Gammaproteobacteria bacterium]|jgi:PPP family 3-phenylpropionic acid transporter